jgi:hypothetical protein
MRGAARFVAVVAPPFSLGLLFSPSACLSRSSIKKTSHLPRFALIVDDLRPEFRLLCVCVRRATTVCENKRKENAGVVPDRAVAARRCGDVDDRLRTRRACRPALRHACWSPHW